MSDPKNFDGFAKVVSEEELNERTSAPRVTLDDIESSIKAQYFFTAEEGVAGHFSMRGEIAKPVNLEALSTLTFCVLVLNNGFTVVGKAACADPANYREDIGRRIAREDAIKQIWPLMGFLLKEKLYQGLLLEAVQ